MENALKDLSDNAKSCNIFDPNVNDIFMSYVKLKQGDYTQVVYYSNTAYRLEIQGFFTDMSFAVNAPERVCKIDTPLSSYRDIPAIYVLDEEAKKDVIAWLDKNVELIRRLEICGQEKLFLYKNSLTFYSSEFSQMIKRTELLYKVLLSLPLVHNSLFSTRTLPRRFKNLIPYIQKWGLGDDLQRRERLAKITSEEKAELLGAVLPCIQDIDDYLDKQKEPLSDIATALGNLAQAAVEMNLR